MGTKLKGKVAIVTGAGQGIGKAIALKLAEEGGSVAIAELNEKTSSETARAISRLGSKSIECNVDVSNYQQVAEMIDRVNAEFGTVDILINNAGIDSPHMIWNMTEDDWDKVIDVSLKGTFNCTRHVSVIMRERRWGRIINTTSSAWLGTVGHCNYGAAKAGIVGLTRAIARELGRYGVTCNAYAPVAATSFTMNEEVLAGLKKRLASGLITKERYDELANLPPPEKVAPFIVYLCTDDAANINGQVFDVHGSKISIYSEPIKLNTFTKDKGVWKIDELIKQVSELMPIEYKNLSPPEE